MREASRLEELAHSLERGWEPEVRLVVDAAFPADLLMRALRGFVTLSRGTRVQLREDVLSGAKDALRCGEADLAISASVPGESLGECLLEVEFVAVAHHDHALHRLGRELTAADLAPELQVVVRDSGERPRATSAGSGPSIAGP